MESGQGERDVRELAIKRLKEKRDFGRHLTMYLAVNGMLIAIWAVVGGGFFWPIFPILGWGIGIGAHAYDTYGRKPFTEEQITREAQRLQR